MNEQERKEAALVVGIPAGSLDLFDDNELALMSQETIANWYTTRGGNVCAESRHLHSRNSYDTGSTSEE